MSDNRIDSTRATVTVEPARARQTQPPATPFRDVLAGGVNILMAGAEAATSVVGGPVLAAAVHEARSDVVTGLAGDGGGGGSAGLTAVTMGAAGPVAGAAGSAGSELATMHAMQRESQLFNMQLINLQEDIQKESRHFNTVSNVLRAKHDTAKSAIGNIRS